MAAALATRPGAPEALALRGLLLDLAAADEDTAEAAALRAEARQALLAALAGNAHLRVEVGQTLARLEGMTDASPPAAAATAPAL